MLYRPGDPGIPAERLGGKGARLVEAARWGLPVPPFVVLGTELFESYRRTGALPDELRPSVRDAIEELESRTGRTFAGTSGPPLLVSVRSSPAHSMPGILDSVLNVGATAAKMSGLEQLFGDDRFALDVRRHFLESWAVVVRGVPRSRFTPPSRMSARPSLNSELSVERILAATDRVLAALSEPPDEDPFVQLSAAVEAVLRSWESARAREHRVASGISEGDGVAVVIQSMVFGNAPSASGAGVAFTRHPVHGEATLFGEFLIGAQGDEVVGGRGSPAGLAAKAAGRRANESLERYEPDAYRELVEIAKQLENEYRDSQELEFTLERGKLFVLQTRTAKRSPRAAVRIAVDMVAEGRIDRREALSRVPASQIDAIASRALVVGPEQAGRRLTTGRPASPGAISGRVVFRAEDAVSATDTVILVRPECSPEDATGIRAAAGVLTGSGGITSHAAVIARALGKPCIVSAEEIRIDPTRARADVWRSGSPVIPLPPVVTIDGSSGDIYEGSLPTVIEFEAPEARALLEWAREALASGAIDPESIPGWAEAVENYLFR